MHRHKIAHTAGTCSSAGLVVGKEGAVGETSPRKGVFSPNEAIAGLAKLSVWVRGCVKPKERGLPLGVPTFRHVSRHRQQAHHSVELDGLYGEERWDDLP